LANLKINNVVFIIYYLKSSNLKIHDIIFYHRLLKNDLRTTSVAI
jgi:hypothetical protein